LIETYRRIAPFYDGDYESLDYDADTPFYVQLARESGGPVLEMGCGTGRVLLAVARAGIRIHGMDLSPDMLRELGAKLAAEPPEVRALVTFSEGDIRTAEAPGKFALITSPFRVVQSFVSRDSQRAWLRNVRRHLRPGGALCFDVFQPNFEYLVRPCEPCVDVDRKDPASGLRIRRFVRTVPHNALQTIDCEFRWVIGEDADGEGSSCSFTLRWFTRGELENLLELEGFEIADYWGTFNRDPFCETSPEQIIRAVARG